MRTQFTTVAIALSAFLVGGTANASPSGMVAFLMPDQGSTRYDEHDWPGFQAEMKKLCPDCKTIYHNANNDVALQQQQFNAAISQGAKVIVIDPVDTGAAASLVKLAQAQGVKVVAYDRPIPDTPADFYVSFDNEALGAALAKSFVEHLKATGVSPKAGGVLQVNGAPTDAAARLIAKGSRAALAASEYKTLAEFDTPGWAPPKAQEWVAGQINRFGTKIVGVVAANDGTGGAAIAALKAAGVVPLPPVTGNDAELAALQRIVAGDQYNTISKPSEIVGQAAAQVAAAFLAGKAPKATTTLYNTPSQLFVPKVVTKENLKSVVVDSGITTAAQLCTGEYAKHCKALGIQ